MVSLRFKLVVLAGLIYTAQEISHYMLDAVTAFTLK